MGTIHKGSLSSSPYVFTMFYQNKELKLFFFTKDKMERFALSYEEGIQDANERIMKLYKYMFNIDLGIFSIIRHYSKIEKRGFYLLYDKDEYTCLNEIEFQLNEIKRLEN